MSFLDMQELATVAAQGDICRLFLGWCMESDVLLFVLEGGVAGGVIAALFKRGG